MSRSRARDDEGTVLLLTLGFTVLVLILVLVVAAATQLHLQRVRLSHLADELALEAADSLDLGRYYAGELDEPDAERAIALGDGALTATVEERLGPAAARSNLPEAGVIEAYSSDGFTATVTVGTTVYPMFGIEALLPWIDGIELTATASARAS